MNTKPKILHAFMDYSREAIPLGWKRQGDLRWNRKRSKTYLRRAQHQNLWFAYIEGKIAIEDRGGMPKMWTSPVDAVGWIENTSPNKFRGTAKK